MTDSPLELAFLRMQALAEVEWHDDTQDLWRQAFDSLRQAVESLSGEKLGAPRLSRIEQARKSWDAYARGGQRPGRRDVAALCWEPQIACSSEFAPLLSDQVPLRRRALRGLMNSYHQRWYSRSPEVESLLKRSLSTMPKPRGILARWLANAVELVGPLAVNELAENCLKARSSVTARLSEWGLSGNSQFGVEAAGRLARLVTETGNAVSAFNYAMGTFFPEDDALIEPARWGEAFHRLVTNTRLTSDAQHRQDLVDLALKTRKLDDPRLRLGQWQNVPPAARDIVMQWLSEEDLRFFFDLLMQGRADPQRRSSFWVKYVNRAIRSRVVVGERDYTRLRPKLDEIRARGRTYARMKGAGGANAHVSAFIMDFGEVTIVEFSQPNSACYIYENDPRNPYLDFTQQVFDWSQLKNRQRGEYHAHVHPPGNWHAEFRRVLAQHGVRPE